jgi:hypothetical protein
LSDEERRNLAKIGKRLGRGALAELATLVKPDTISAWHRRLVFIGVNTPEDYLVGVTAHAIEA